MGYKILDVKEDIKDNVSDWIIGEWYMGDPDTEEAQELVDSINGIVDKHFEKFELFKKVSWKMED